MPSQESFGITMRPRGHSWCGFVLRLGWPAAFATMLSCAALAQNDVTLAWDPSPATDIARYNLYFGSTSRTNAPYASVVSVGNVATGTLTNLVSGLTYYFAVTAVDQYGNESDYSNEASYTVPGTLPQPGLRTCLSPSGGVALDVAGVPGHCYEVLSSYDAVNWVLINTITIGSSGDFGFVDSSAVATILPTYVIREVSTPIPVPPSIEMSSLPDGAQVLDVFGTPGRSYDILSSQSLVNWTLIGTKTLDPNGTFAFVDFTLGNPPFPFYRLRETGSSDPAPPVLQIAYSSIGQVSLEVIGQPGLTYQVFRTFDHTNLTVAATGTTDSTGTFWALDWPGGTPFPYYELHPASTITADVPPLSFSTDPSGAWVVTITGEAGQTYEALSSTDLVAWTVVDVGTAGPDGSLSFVDPNADVNFPPYYQVREINGAATSGPMLALWLDSNGQVNLEGTGCVADEYEVQATSDFASWQVIGVVTAVDGTLSFTAGMAGDFPARFYRLHESSAATAFWNTAQTASASCDQESGAPPPTGDPVTVTVPADSFSSTVSQADADSRALGSALAQAQATCSCTYLNAEQSYTATCPGTTTGDPVTATIAAGSYTSTISQADADSQALVAARNSANSQLSCAGEPPLFWNTPQVCSASAFSASCSNPIGGTAPGTATVMAIVPNNLFSDPNNQLAADQLAAAAGNAFAQQLAQDRALKGLCGNYSTTYPNP